jgi:hypothetical protein
MKTILKTFFSQISLRILEPIKVLLILIVISLVVLLFSFSHRLADSVNSARSKPGVYDFSQYLTESKLDFNNTSCSAEPNCITKMAKRDLNITDWQIGRL